MSDIVISGDAVASLMAESAMKVFKANLEGYKSPLEPIINDAFKVHADPIRKAIYKATEECVNSPSFGEQLVAALNHKLANLVINKCSGLVEKSFHDIMQEPILRNKLQSAVIQILQENKTK